MVVENYSDIINSLNLKDKYKSTITKTMKELLKVGNPYLEEIILFGSCARGTTKLGSDIDLLCLTSKKLEERKDRLMFYNSIPIDTEVEVDLLIRTKELFESESDWFLNIIKKEGVVLWKA